MPLLNRRVESLSPETLRNALAAAQRERIAAIDTRDVALPERDAVVRSLAAMVRILRREGGYMVPEDQRALRVAEALIAECSR